jgi:two-component system response regulator AtoC
LLLVAGCLIGNSIASQIADIVCRMPDLSTMPVGGASVVPGSSPVMLGLYAAAAKLAELETPVLILGELGTGKRTLARCIHDISPRRNEPFRLVDATQFSAAVAKGNSTNRLLGSDGMIFLCDTAQMSSPAQQKILQVIQGGRRAPRVIVASNEELDHAVRARRVDEEFYHAIGSVCLRIPPLRARREDIAPLSEHFLRQYSRAFGRPKPELSAEALEFFRSYRWPGNVAEMETAMKSLVAIGDEALVLAAVRASAWATGRTDGARTASLKQAARAASLEAERELIFDVLTSTGWNRKRAAQRLQVSYKALLYKLKRIGIESPALHPRAPEPSAAETPKRPVEGGEL